ncbi:MAG: DUF3488 domain-containing protein, partial [Deltaproteobacteria bacterium]|nr:DUF3488 domain-containing protein [Deltaproteobacteria bacterium]
MNKNSSIFFVPTLSLLVLSLFLHSKDIWPSVFLALFILISVFVKPGRVDTIGQIIGALVTAAISYTYFFVINEPENHVVPGYLSTIAQTVIVFFTGYCAFRLYLKNPGGSHTGTSSFILFAWLFSGAAHLSPAFGIMSVTGVLLLFYGHGKSNGLQPDFSSMSSRRLKIIISGIIFSLAVAALISFTLPLMYQKMMERYYNNIWIERSGFSNVIKLGSIKNMMQSNEIVMRIFTKPAQIQQLRGIVYNGYYNGLWSISNAKPSVELDTKLEKPSTDLIEIRISGGDKKRYFFPLNASEIYTESPTSEISPYGIVRPSAGNRDEHVWFKPGKNYRFKISNPEYQDTNLPKKLKERVLPLAKKVAGNTSDNYEKVQNIKRFLTTDFKY